MNYTIFKKDSGEITQLVSTPFHPMFWVSDSEDFIEGFVDEGHYIDTISKTAVRFPSKEKPFLAFDFNTKQWYDPRSLEQVKEQHWELIKSKRASKEFSSFEYNGAFFDGDALSQQRIQGAVQLATIAVANNQPFSLDWTLADNSVINLDAQQTIGLGFALAAHVNNAHIQSRIIRARIDAATSIEEVESITYD